MSLGLYDFAPSKLKLKSLSFAELSKEPPTFEAIFASEQAERRERFPEFAELVQIEPALAILEKQVCEIRRTHDSYASDKKRPFDFCANTHWYGHTNLTGTGPVPLLIVRTGIRGALHDLVGWFAAKRELRTERAYDVAYDHLYSLLPDCHGCNCC